MEMKFCWVTFLLLFLNIAFTIDAPPPNDRVFYKGTPGLPGNGIKLVFIAGDEEYRSEEAIPVMARILSVNHGFESVVLWSQDENGFIDPDALTNIPGLEELEDADLLFIFMRFRAPDDDKMRFFDNYVNSGRPIIGVRTATHSFNFDDAGRGDSIFRDFYQFDVDGGFGRHVLGETYAGQVGDNGGQGTHGFVTEGQENNPIVNGIDDDPGSIDSIHGNSNLYLVSEFWASTESTSVITGELLNSLDPLSGPAPGVDTESIGWTRTFTGPTPTSLTGESNQSPIFTTTIGVSNDDGSIGVRRLLVNAVYERLGLDVPKKADVGLIFDFNPTNSGVGGSVVQGRFTPMDFADVTAPIPPVEEAMDVGAGLVELIERDPWVLVLMILGALFIAVVLGVGLRGLKRNFDRRNGVENEGDLQQSVEYTEMASIMYD